MSFTTVWFWAYGYPFIRFPLKLQVWSGFSGRRVQFEEPTYATPFNQPQTQRGKLIAAEYWLVHNCGWIISILDAVFVRSWREGINRTRRGHIDPFILCVWICFIRSFVDKWDKDQNLNCAYRAQSMAISFLIISLIVDNKSGNLHVYKFCHRFNWNLPIPGFYHVFLLMNILLLLGKREASLSSYF